MPTPDIKDLTTTPAWGYLYNRRLPRARVLSIEPSAESGELQEEIFDPLLTTLQNICTQTHLLLARSSASTLSAEQQILVASFFEAIPPYEDQYRLFAINHNGVFTFYDEFIASYLLRAYPWIGARFILDHIEILCESPTQIRSVGNGITIPQHIAEFIQLDSFFAIALRQYSELATMLLIDITFVRNMISISCELAEKNYEGLIPLDHYIHLIAKYVEEELIQSFLKENIDLISTIIQRLNTIPEQERSTATHFSSLVTFLNSVEVSPALLTGFPEIRENYFSPRAGFY